MKSLNHHHHDLSIIIPSYNQGLYIEEALQSILNQPDLSVQIIVMDGGSTDSTVLTLEKYSSVITYSSEPDNGQAHALNKALRLVSAPLVGWLNSDDKYMPGALSFVHKIFQENPEVVLVHGQRVLIDDKSQVIGWARPGPFVPETNKFNICSETTFWRRDMVSHLSFSESLQFAVDTQFLSLIARDHPSLYLHKFIGCFRCHSLSKSSTMWHSHAVREANEVWYQLFGRSIDLAENESDSSLASKISGLLSLPLNVSLPYLAYRLRRLLDEISVI